MKTPNTALAAKLNIAAWIITALVLALVGLMRRVKIPIPDHWDFSLLPPFHAAVNALTAITLITALYFIRHKNIAAHRNAIYFAMGLSVLFLLSYVTYHFTTPETLYGDVDGNGKLDAGELSAVGASRTVYLVILISHIVLAALSLPLILFTFIRAFTHQYDLHRNMARWVFPLWLYVAITGPVCYWMLKPFYP
jgi:putative membrane protein